MKVIWQGGQLADIPVTNFAFGANVQDTAFANAQRLTIEVRRVQGNRADLVLTRKVNKGPGPIGVDLRVNEADVYSIPGGLPRGVGLIGLPVDPYASSAADLFELADNATQAARWNGLRGRFEFGLRGRFEFFPECGAFRQGLSFFVRGESAKSVDIAGRALPSTPIAVALRPGWNLIANPLQESVPTSRVQVAVAADFPTPYETAKGQSIGDAIRNGKGPVHRHRVLRLHIRGSRPGVGGTRGGHVRGRDDVRTRTRLLRAGFRTGRRDAPLLADAGPVPIFGVAAVHAAGMGVEGRRLRWRRVE